MDDITQQREIYTVSRLNLEARGLLEAHFPLLWVEAELFNVSRPASGHLYFTLKDTHAQLSAAMFRNRNQHLGFAPQPGLQVLVRGRLSLYEARGSYQFIVEHMEEAGEGALRRAFDELKRKLAAAGLFDAQRKRALPAYPQALGVITSPSGAALRDVISVLRRRFPALPVYVYPVSVQGVDAAPGIVAALARANQEARCDVLLLVRGGGSLEDLWAFNEERVARAIAASELPVVSGVGHETDFTIADFVADLRAPTPSAAAELVSPDAQQILHRLDRLAEALRGSLQRHVAQQARHLDSLHGRLARRHPVRQLQQYAQRIDELDARMRRAAAQRQHRAADRLQTLRTRLLAQSPARTLDARSKRLALARHALRRAMSDQLETARGRLAGLSRTLSAVSPLATLERGYALALQPGSLTPVRDAADVHIEQALEVRLARGTLLCRVEATEDAT
ncbi:exodeoxyribonuclease VII large subunit [Acidihalobacter ferrooxydans]|uniref:Exodeoxyribonuclease 7 large subunit n=1 Tax=Acidihalobacter ferrooxydans TaxID=1765967 RepID=A0A1P8UEY9_9GAMM|nr:exodeoxyribonuclease VII large subunit [Acidihalobacter ferrooxydans]APZ42348.1 exodeoxyribonuclease VII large subunit [Acidihalobacter ferrooxydans]